MNPGDPNVLRVEVVAEALGDLCDELVLVGGCAASLLIDAPSASPARVTYDVDVIAEVAALHGYHALERKFAGRGSLCYLCDIAQRATYQSDFGTGFSCHQA